MNYPNKTISLLQPLTIMIVIVTAVFYSVNVMNTGDWLWFKSETVVPRPSRIVIVDHGQSHTLSPGYPGYPQLADAIAGSVNRVTNSDLINIGLSESTLDYYAHSSLVLEVYFDRPLRFHTSFRAGEPTQLLIPISGRHAGSGYFFRGAQGEWWYGALSMADPAPIYAVLTELGYEAELAQR